MSDQKKLVVFEWVIILSFCLLPLFLKFPYRINIFLSWEGAYRISSGQVPFRDFGMPLGFVYWLVPAFFFKVFGPYLLTLVKAQIFINFISLILLRGILKIFRVEQGIRLIVILLFCISYILVNFWPWYNNTVFVYQLGALFCLLKAVECERVKKQLAFITFNALLGVFSFFTKQDGGALAIVLNLFLLAWSSWSLKKWWFLPYFIAVTIAGFLFFILPFSPYDFGYWFNYGQEPHFSRLEVRDLIFFVLQGSFWIKFYLVIVVILILIDIRSYGIKEYIKQHKLVLFTLLTLGIIVQASIIQVTSYVPINNNIYFHSFCLAYILSNIKWPFNPSRPDFALIGGMLIMIWWSGSYYKYLNRVISRFLPGEKTTSKEVVSVRTYNRAPKRDTTEVKVTMSAKDWVSLPGMRAFKGMYLPETTVEGVKRLENMNLWKTVKNPKVLNMTEMTPLAYELGFELEVGPKIPLWFHQNVSFFEREMKFYKKRINEGYYDLVLFENIPNLNNFYPFELREHLHKHYKLIDTFDAPRKHGGSPKIEVFVPDAKKL